MEHTKPVWGEETDDTQHTLRDPTFQLHETEHGVKVLQRTGGSLSVVSPGGRVLATVPKSVTDHWSGEFAFKLASIFADQVEEIWAAAWAAAYAADRENKK